MFKYTILLAAVVSIILTKASDQDQKSNEVLKVSLYYEALCPDCQTFIKTQLYPGFKKLDSYLQMDLVPYGKASQEKVNGSWHFRCQHGPRECFLNKLHACGIAEEKGQDKTMEFIYCLDSNRDVRNCASKLDVDSDVLLLCANGEKGNNLLAKYGDRTNSVRSLIRSVPAVFFDDNFDIMVDAAAIRDFFGTACKQFVTRPNVCPASNDKSDGVLKVSLYYEALCPGCRTFIKTQLYPGFKKLNSYLQMDLVPYGNAAQEKINGSWHFRCQHGPKECFLNKLHACGIAEEKGQDNTMEFIYCLDSNRDLVTCASKLGVASDVLLLCANGEKGDNLLAKYGERTNSIKSLIRGVPALFFDDKFDIMIDAAAMRDFFGTACKQFSTRPNVCPASDEVSVVVIK